MRLSHKAMNASSDSTPSFKALVSSAMPSVAYRPMALVHGHTRGIGELELYGVVIHIHRSHIERKFRPDTFQKKTAVACYGAKKPNVELNANPVVPAALTQRKVLLAAIRQVIFSPAPNSINSGAVASFLPFKDAANGPGISVWIEGAR